MKVIMSDFIHKFQCVAGDCPATCCSGWKIKVDEEAVLRFNEIADESLRKDIMSHLEENEDGYYFLNRNDGRCTMLDDDGLCRIQRNTEEKMLCNTCRKYPRLYAKDGEMMYMAAAVSCPVIAGYLVREEMSWTLITEDNHRKKIDLCEVSAFGKEIWSLQREILRMIRIPDEAADYIHLYKNYTLLTDELRSVILKYPHITYYDNCFTYYDNDHSAIEIIEDVSEFLNSTYDIWKKAALQYAVYRDFIRNIELPGENYQQRFIQIKGELFLISATAFNRYQEMLKGHSCLSIQDIEEIFIWSLYCAYRFCAHGKEISKQISSIFKKMILN